MRLKRYGFRRRIEFTEELSSGYGAPFTGHHARLGLRKRRYRDIAAERGRALRSLVVLDAVDDGSVNSLFRGRNSRQQNLRPPAPRMTGRNRTPSHPCESEIVIGGHFRNFDVSRCAVRAHP